MELNKDQVKALQDFADVNGRYWKNKLIQLWAKGQDGGLLRQVRNDFGPVWLRTQCKIKPVVRFDKYIEPEWPMIKIKSKQKETSNE